MAQIYVTGPVAIWIKYPFEGAPRFLGHGERAPTVELMPIWVDVRCDVGGEAVFDRIYSGEGARVSIDLVRYNHNVMDGLRARAKSTTFPNGVAGYDDPGMIGTLALVEGSAYTLYLTMPFANKAPFQNVANGALPLGYRFRAAVMDPESFQGGSANPYKFHLSWTCYRIFDPTQTNAFGFGSFTLWDQNMGEIAGLAIN